MTIAIIAVVSLVLLFLIVSYNGIVRLRNRIDAAFAQIDVQLRRRHDLIPNLVETVKGYAEHERGTFESVTRARQQAVSATGVQGQARAEGELTQSLRQLLAVAEAYPDLKANQNFLALQEELTGTESRIAFSRHFYNEQVLAYDTRIQSFPGNVFASVFNFTPRQYFETEEDSRGAVQVDLGGRSAPPA
ncbi:MAG: LemA family protein [Actinomycetota bacterium]|nr:LemA family protein [Actinomycetota bacterium]